MKRQRGATLIVVLVMLVVITLLAIATIRISNSSMLIVGNMQARKFVENWGQQGIEQVVNSIAPFNAPTSTVTITGASGGSLPGGISVTVGNRTCLFSAPASGYSAVSTIAPEDNLWEFQVTVADSLTGAGAVMVQGVKIRQLAGFCP
jgi:uncharacterized membrane protein YphA (DoxX/SURF4 family)